MKHMGVRIALLVSTTASLVAVATQPANAYDLHCGKFNTSSIGVYFHNLASGKIDRTREAINNWNASSVDVYLREAVPPLQNIQVQDGTYTWSYPATTTYSCTNGFYTNNLTNLLYNSPVLQPMSQKQVRFIAVHELGHNLSLDHNSTLGCPDTIMAPNACIYSTTMANPPKQDDVDGVNSVY